MSGRNNFPFAANIYLALKAILNGVSQGEGAQRNTISEPNEIPSQSRTKYHRRAELKYNLIAFVSEMLGHGFATKLKSFQLKLRDEV